MLVDIQFSPTVLLFVIYCNFCASSVFTLWNSAFIGLLPNVVFLHWEAAGFLECEEPCPPCCWRSRIHMDGQIWFWKDENWAGMLSCICTLYFSLLSNFHHISVYHVAAYQIPKKLLSDGDVQRDIHASENGSAMSGHQAWLWKWRCRVVTLLFVLVFVNVLYFC